MFMQLDKLERAGPINADPAGEISKARAAQTIVGASNVEPLTLAEPIVEGFVRRPCWIVSAHPSRTILDRVGTSWAGVRIADSGAVGERGMSAL